MTGVELRGALYALVYVQCIAFSQMNRGRLSECGDIQYVCTCECVRILVNMCGCKHLYSTCTVEATVVGGQPDS